VHDRVAEAGEQEQGEEEIKGHGPSLLSISSLSNKVTDGIVSPRRYRFRIMYYLLDHFIESEKGSGICILTVLCMLQYTISAIERQVILVIPLIANS